MKAAVEHHFTGLTAPLSGTYDATKTLLSTLIKQNSGSGAENNYISPKPAAMVNIPEIAVSSQMMPHVVKWSNNIYWVFAASNAAVAITRTVTLFEFDSNQGTITYKGFITLNGVNVPGNKTVRSMRAFVYEHTTGSVSTSGTSTSIIGNGTQFVTERIAVGARIGFNTTDPTQVSTWYEITGISNDTALTISGPVSLSAGTPYVIEEIRIALAVTNATLINGGVHLIKGLNYGTFTQGGTTIPEATTIDNIRASYLLLDQISGSASASFTATAATPAVFTLNNHGLLAGDVVYLTNVGGALPASLTANTAYYVIPTGLSASTFQLSTTYNGTAVPTTTTGTGTHFMHAGSSKIAATIAADDFVNFTDHSLYLINATSITTTFASTATRYNMRNPLSVRTITAGMTGSSDSAFVLKTAPMTYAGPISQVNTGRIFSVAHGAASGSKSLWFATTGIGTTRVYRCPISNITAGSTNWIGDSMLEVPPGSTTTYPVTSNFVQVDYSSTIDRILIPTGANRFGVYISPYDTAGAQFEKLIGANLNRLKLTTTPQGASDGLFPTVALTVWTEDGWMFAIPNVTAAGSAGTNWLYVWPFGTDAFYNSTSNQHVITPKLATPNATKLSHVYVDHQEYAGTYGLGFPVESYRVWYRTSGIDDNTGPWTELPLGADLTSAAPGDYIQFKIAFDIMGELCVPTRIYSICCTYEDGSQDSHYEPSLTKSSAQNRQFAWRQIVGWGSNIPNLRIRLYNVANNALVLDDDITSNAYGLWEYSTNGTNWITWDNTQDAIGNYIRYSADAGVLGNGITVRALLTQV